MKAKGGRKGYVMLIDAIISIIVITSVIYVFFLSSGNEMASRQNSREFKEMHYLSEDVIDVLNKQGILDEIGNEWAAANGSLISANWSNAVNLSTEYLNKTIPKKFGYRMLIDEDVIYDSDLDPLSGRPREKDSDTKTHSSRMLVGYGAGLPTRGHVARAFLTEIAEKTTSSYAYFGGFEGQGNLSKTIQLPDETDNVTNICMEYNSGDAFNLFINGMNAGNFPGNPAGDMNATYQCVTSAPPSSFKLAGSNLYTFNISFQGSDRRHHYVAGGYIKMTYNTSEPDTSGGSGVSRYEFPGINGVINLYSSFYVPGNLDSMSLHAIFMSDYNTSIRIGNISILDTSDMESRKFCTIVGSDHSCDVPDVNISALLAEGGLSYLTDLSERTVPLSMVERNLTAVSLGLADVVLITDLSESMSWRIGYNDATTGTLRDCEDASLYENDTRRTSLAKCLDKEFINRILNVSGNRVGLIGFNSSVYSFYALSSDNETLINEVEAYTDDPSNGSCICCAINKAIELLGSAQEIVSVDLIPDVESPHPYPAFLSPPGSGTWVINGHPSAIQMRVHFTSIITSENKTAGPNNYADYLWVTDANGQKVRMNGWEANERANEIDVYANDEIEDYWSGWGNGSFMTVKIESDDGIHGGGNPKENGFIIDRYEYIKSGTATDRARYIVIMSDGVPNYDCGNCGAYPGCGGCTSLLGLSYCGAYPVNCVGGACTGAISDAICTSRRALTEFGAKVYTIGLGSVVGCANAESTLQQMASVGDGEYDASNNATELEDIYEYVAERIVNATDRSQKLSVAGHLTRSMLYPESYLEFAYTPTVDYSEYGSITLTYDTGGFNDTLNCEGSIYAPMTGVISDAKVTSYSGEHWSDYLSLNASEVYTLRDEHFGDDYLSIGDPYIIQIPASYLSNPGNYTVELSTGDGPDPPYTGCSPNNSAIYTLRIDPSVGYGDVFPEKNGCNWTIQYEDGSNTTESIPSNYNGTKNCSFTETNVSYGTGDAVDEAIYRLLQNLDSNNNNKTDIKFESDMVEFDYSRAGGVESLWGPITVKLVIWM